MMLGNLTKISCIRALGINLFDFQLKSRITSYAKIVHPFYQDLFRTTAYRNRIVFENEFGKKTVLPANVDEASLSSLNSKEFIEVLQNVFLDNFKPMDSRLKNLLKKECFNRQPDFDNVTTFYCADILKKSNLYFDDYISAVSRTLMFKWNDIILTKQDALLLANFLSLSNNSMMLPLMDKIETYLRENIFSMTPREVGLMCHLFFTTNSRIKEFSTMEALKSFTLSTISKKSNFYLSDLNNVVKVLRHANYSNVPFFMEMGNKLCTDILNSSCSFTNLSNLAFTYSSVYVEHEALLKGITKIFVDKIENPGTSSIDYPTKYPQTARLKDFGRLLWANACFGFEVPDVLVKQAIHLIKSDPNHAFNYPEIFIETLTALAIHGTHDPELLKLAFSRNFINFKKRRMLEQDTQMLLIHSASKIEGGIHPEIDLETEEYLKSLIPDNSERLKNDIMLRQGLATSIDAIQKVLGDWSLFKVHNILDFSRVSDIEMLVNKSGEPVSWKQESAELKEFIRVMKPKQDTRRYSILEEVLREEEQDSPSGIKYESIHMRQDSTSFPKKVCIKAFGRNQYARNSPTLNGYHQLELRLLHKSGYEVYVIDPETAEDLERATEKERIKFLSEILKKCGVAVDKKL